MVSRGSCNIFDFENPESERTRPSAKDFHGGKAIGSEGGKVTVGARTVIVHRGKKWSEVCTAEG